MNFEKCRKFRDDYQRRLHLKFYHVSLHLFINLLLVLSAVMFVISKFHEELDFSVPFLFCSVLLWGLLEYGIHRFIMHKLLSRINLAYKEHTLNHHFYFVDKFNFTTSQKDFVRIFFQPLDVVLIIYCANSILALVFFNLINANFSLHFFLVGNVYYLIYEFLHYVYHSGNDSFFQKIGLFKTLIRHHQIHHNQLHMNHGNFSLLFPALDSLFGTRVKEP